MEAPPETSREPHILKHGTKKICFVKYDTTLSQNFLTSQQISSADTLLARSQITIMTIVIK
jgi:hypothetical protein